MKIFIINSSSPQQQVGGSQIQCWLIAKYLAKLRHATAYLAVQNLKSQDKQAMGEGFNVHYLISQGQNKLKIFINFYQLLKKQKPDLCYIRVFKYLFFFYKICQFLKIPVVFNTSHIRDCQPDLIKIKFSLNIIKFLKSIQQVILRRLNFHTFKKIKIVTINKYHSQLLKNKYNISATPIYNSMEDNYDKNQANKQKQIVWANGIKERKRPEIFIQLANQFKQSDYQFLMVGEFQNRINYYKKMIKQAEEKNKNFKYLGAKTVKEIDKILAQSQLFVNTCLPEGFGNNFIQAWLSKCPTLTLSFDPDNIIEKNKIGCHSKTLEQLVKNLKTLIKDKKLRQEMGERARKYALENHNILSNIKKYEQVFKEVA